MDSLTNSNRRSMTLRHGGLEARATMRGILKRFFEKVDTTFYVPQERRLSLGLLSAQKHLRGGFDLVNARPGCGDLSPKSFSLMRRPDRECVAKFGANTTCLGKNPSRWIAQWCAYVVVILAVPTICGVWGSEAMAGGG
ncbi:MAG: hypothetical protein ACTSY1_06200 [Alphaproteobacteria bacterium]